jgi:hypothetical protein
MGFLPLFVRWLTQPRVTMPHGPGMFFRCYPMIVPDDQAELLAQAALFRSAVVGRFGIQSLDQSGTDSHGVRRAAKGARI